MQKKQEQKNLIKHRYPNALWLLRENFFELGRVVQILEQEKSFITTDQGLQALLNEFASTLGPDLLGKEHNKNPGDIEQFPYAGNRFYQLFNKETFEIDENTELLKLQTLARVIEAYLKKLLDNHSYEASLESVTANIASLTKIMMERQNDVTEGPLAFSLDPGNQFKLPHLKTDKNLRPIPLELSLMQNYTQTRLSGLKEEYKQAWLEGSKKTNTIKQTELTKLLELTGLFPYAIPYVVLDTLKGQAGLELRKATFKSKTADTIVKILHDCPCYFGEARSVAKAIQENKDLNIQIKNLQNLLTTTTNENQRKTLTQQIQRLDHIKFCNSHHKELLPGMVKSEGIFIVQFPSTSTHLSVKQTLSAATPIPSTPGQGGAVLVAETPQAPKSVYPQHTLRTVRRVDVDHPSRYFQASARKESEQQSGPPRSAATPK